MIVNHDVRFKQAERDQIEADTKRYLRRKKIKPVGNTPPVEKPTKTVYPQDYNNRRSEQAKHRKNKLTPMQRITMAFIQRFNADNGRTPSQAELASNFKLKPEAARRRIVELEKKGALEFHSKKKTQIVII